LIEYVVMFRRRASAGVRVRLMWAWVSSRSIYGTLWLLLLAYLTVFLPLGVRTTPGHAADRQSLEECAQMCGAPWAFRVRTVTIPLLHAGSGRRLAAAVHRQHPRAGASILLMGPHSKVITPVDRRIMVRTSSELTAAWR